MEGPCSVVVIAEMEVSVLGVRCRVLCIGTGNHSIQVVCVCAAVGLPVMALVLVRVLFSGFHVA